ncbi:CPBP family intramembrane glutamic endopeptidase [Virgibacillus dokdonensis]|uniref:CPBP family intramembrane glutamic endopeptidase n=1 Tax=Virgibacillus dokdonensis TaxID=302167 RepID=UPI000989BE3D|nr:type II CAAX endopeptidase family protein [Virgibacillus dokdonensis]
MNSINRQLSEYVLFVVFAFIFSQIVAFMFGSIGLILNSELLISIFQRIGQLLGLFGFFIIWYRDITYLRSLGLDTTQRNSLQILNGFFMALTVQTLIIVTYMLTGAELVRLSNSVPYWILFGFAPGMIIHTCVGLVEEFLFRGFLYNHLKKYLPVSVAILLQAALFSLAHLFNPGYSFSAFIGLTIFGILMALLLDYKGSLLLPISFHAMWNLSEGTVFGFAVSGREATSLLKFKVSQNELLHAGEFGSEAGVISMIILSFSSIALLLYTRKLNRNKTVKAS